MLVTKRLTMNNTNRNPFLVLVGDDGEEIIALPTSLTPVLSNKILVAPAVL